MLEKANEILEKTIVWIKKNKEEAIKVYYRYADEDAGPDFIELLDQIISEEYPDLDNGDFYDWIYSDIYSDNSDGEIFRKKAKYTLKNLMRDVEDELEYKKQ
jgi:hypothetical protein